MIGGGNDFAELQAVEEIFVAREFNRRGLGKGRSWCSFTAVRAGWVKLSPASAWTSIRRLLEKPVRSPRPISGIAAVRALLIYKTRAVRR